MNNKNIYLDEIEWVLLDDREFKAMKRNNFNTGLFDICGDSKPFHYFDKHEYAQALPSLKNPSEELLEQLRDHFMAEKIKFLNIRELDDYLEYAPVIKTFFSSNPLVKLIATPYSDRLYALNNTDILYRPLDEKEIAQFLRILNTATIAKFEDDERKRESRESFMKDFEDMQR